MSDLYHSTGEMTGNDADLFYFIYHECPTDSADECEFYGPFCGQFCGYSKAAEIRRDRLLDALRERIIERESEEREGV